MRAEIIRYGERSFDLIVSDKLCRVDYGIFTTYDQAREYLCLFYQSIPEEAISYSIAMEVSK